MLRDRDYTLGVTGRVGNTSLPMGGVAAGRGSIDICDFSPPRRWSPFESRIVVSAVGALASSLLHVALLTTAIWAGSPKENPTRRPERVTAPRGQVSDEIGMQWVTFDDSAATDSSRPATPANLPPPPLTPIAMTAELAEFATHFPEATPDIPSTSVANDSESSARLYGQYLGQINARIDRAWMRPRAPIGADRFLCQVRVEQDAVGNVTEITLEQCNGDSRWQLSLVHAIESASPLPAPTDPSVFAHAIHLSFQSEDLKTGMTADQYEPASAVTQLNHSERTVQHSH